MMMASVAGVTAVPRIELDLSDLSKISKVAYPIMRPHDLALTQPNGDVVMSRQDWTERCEAGPATTLAKCPFPVAKAFDEFDGHKVDVTTRVFLVDVDGHTCGTSNDHAKCTALCPDSADCEVTSVSFAQRSTYLFKYDATDKAGNHAEQVVFALILDDTIKPTLTVCDGPAETVEAASPTWKLCTGSNAGDNIDGNISHEITYSIYDQDNPKVPLCLNAQYKDYVNYLADSQKPDWDGMSAKAHMVPCAKSALATTNVGRYLVEFKVCDKAGVYGENSQRNCVIKHKAVQIKDTLKPWIDVHGAEPTLHECGMKYTDLGATVHDLLDTDALNLDLNAAPYYTVGGDPVLSTVVGDYEIKYEAEDHATNKADPKTRLVQVRDTTKPVMFMDGEHEVIVETCDPNHPDRNADHAQHNVDNAKPPCSADPSKPKDWPVTCTDSCGGNSDGDLANLNARVKEDWDRQFTGVDLGDYIRTYTCDDPEGNASFMTRKFTVVDSDTPVITLMGDDELTYPASVHQEYVDKGAECHDHVDGVLSKAVEISGNVVNMRIPGKYIIKYDCQDLSGNKAKQMTRMVTIQDNSCPTVTINTPNVVYIEAGFDFTDPGATAIDDLDGDISSKIWKTGDTVDGRSAFYSRRSCAEILASVDSPPATGEYYITTKVGDAFTRTLVMCDFLSEDKSGDVVGYTYVPCDSCEQVQPYSTEDGGCADKGLKMAQFTDNDADTLKWAKEQYGSQYFPQAESAETDTYLCTAGAIDKDEAFHAHEKKIEHGLINRAEAGKYVITYHVQDSAGNAQCADSLNVRTVIVRDSLPPVITLHLKDHGLIHTSDGHAAGNMGYNDGPVHHINGAAKVSANPTGQNSEVNPALGMENPSIKNDPSDTDSLRQRTENAFPRSWFMAEESSSSVNGWVIGAAASAVTGLALLSMTLRKVPAVVEV
jgi:hypothetical protein